MSCSAIPEKGETKQTQKQNQNRPKIRIEPLNAKRGRSTCIFLRNKLRFHE